MKQQSAVVHFVVSLWLLVSFLIICNLSQAQVPDKLPLDQFKLAKQKIPPYHQQFLSSTALNMFQLVDTFSPDQSGPEGGFATWDNSKLLDRQKLMASRAMMTPMDTSVRGPVRVSDPRRDFLLSAVGGFTQSETSSAWCGNNVVVGFNDGASVLETLSLPARSFSGAAFSVDGGMSFIDIGPLNPGVGPRDFIVGDPVVACTSNRRFLYANLFVTSTRTMPLEPLTAVSLSTSNNSGRTWSAPLPVVSKSAMSHFLDKDWMAVDPTTPTRIYITYTDFDFTFTSPACPNDFRTAIELVSSSDGGATWSAPVVVKEVCGQSTVVQGSNIAVAGNGSLYVAFEFSAGASREIHVRKSTDHGGTFGPEVTLSTLVPTGASGRLQGGFRTNEFPSLAVDLASGTIYATFTAGANVGLDALGYAYSDVMISSSTDGGMTWSPATAISPTDPAFSGIGRDQFMPGVAVDSTGTVAVCYYDRRNDPTNIAIDRFCSVSTNHTQSFTDQQVSTNSWLPFHAMDLLVNPFYMGDYDGLTTDKTRANAGFFGAFQIQNGLNPDVFSKRF